MNKILLSLFFSLFSILVHAQDDIVTKKIPVRDSILLADFLNHLKSAINIKDKSTLSKLINFPFYCRPCIDDTALHLPADAATVKVSKKLFLQSQFHLFFDGKMEQPLKEHDDLGIDFLIPDLSEENTKQQSFFFPYTIIAPSATWEGSQGFIYVNKVKRYLQNNRNR